MQHLDEGTIHAWLDGALDEGGAESSRVARHVDECAECAALVAEARGLVAGASRIVSSLDVVRGGVIPPSLTPARAPARTTLRHRFRIPPTVAAIAATLIVAVVSTLSVRSIAREKSAVPAPAHATQDTAQRAVPGERPASEPVSPVARPPSPGASTASVASAPARASANSTPVRAAEVRDAAAKKVPASPAEEATARAMSPQRAVAGAAGAASGVASPILSSAPSMKTLPGAPSMTRADSSVAGAARGREVSRVRDVSSAVADEARSDSARRALDSISRETFAARRVTQLSGIVSTSAMAKGRMGAAVDRAYLGCYALDAELPKWANAFPARFALDEMVIADTTPERRMIRAVTPDGKIDGPIASAWWQTTPITTGGSGGSTSAEITWTTGPAPLHLTIGLTPGEGGVRATVRDVSRAEVIRVTRISCSP